MAEQRCLAEAFIDSRLGANAKLERIAGPIDWERLRPLLGKLRATATGRPAYAPLAMLEALYLQALYDLSDPGLEEALLDRLFFRHFCGFALDAGTPDETTVCQAIGIVGFIGDQAAGRCGDAQQRDRHADVGGVVGCRGKGDRSAAIIGQAVDLQGPPTARATDRFLPLYLFEPAAERRAFTWVLSIDNSSGTRPAPAIFSNRRCRDQLPRLCHPRQHNALAQVVKSPLQPRLRIHQFGLRMWGG